MFNRMPDYVIAIQWDKVTREDGGVGLTGEIVDDKGTQFPVVLAVIPDPVGSFLGVVFERGDMSYNWAPFDSQEEAIRETEAYAVHELIKRGYFGNTHTVVRL